MSAVPRFYFNPGRVFPVGSSGAYIQDWDIGALLMSEPHWKLRNGAWSGGGSFYMRKQSVTHTSKGPVVMVHFDVESISNPCGAAGGPMPYRPNLSLLRASSHPSFSSQKAAVAPYHATGYARTRPGNPVAGLGQFLAELRDLPQIPLKGIWSIPFSEIPKVLRNRLLTFKNLGNEYLNVVFGWKPFVKDLQDMYNLWKTIDARMAKIVRENNKAIRRRTTLKDELSVTQTVTEYPYPFANVYDPPPGWGSGHTHYTLTTSTAEKIWYVGRYKYYIPDTSSSLWNARARLALFGALPTPELLWEVMPWSWLIDWFTNVGDVVSNFSVNAVDNLISLGAYTMHSTTVTTEVSAAVSMPGKHEPGPGPPTGYKILSDWDPVDFSYQTTHKSETKVRVGGTNPFGLDVKLDGLSPYQLSILAALGLSRGLVR